MNQTDIGLKLLQSGDYYVSRPMSESYDWSSYWQPKPDPDGKVRDRSKEREFYLRQVADEVEFVERLKPERLLDIGCGRGWFLGAVEHSANRRHGIDPGLPISERMGSHEVAARRALSAWNCDLTFVYDLIRAHHVIEHIPNPIEAIKQIHAMLKPGGWFLISTPDFDSQAARRFGDRYRMSHDESHCSLFSAESLMRFVRDHGFTIKRIEYPFWDVEEWLDWDYQSKHQNEPHPLGIWAAMTEPDDCDVSPPFPGSWITLYCQKD